MKRKKLSPRFSMRCLCLIALSVAVYGYWYFLCPYKLLAREQSLLFLWNREFFAERIAVPGGMAQYLGEFLTQFFISPAYGALIYALLFAMAYLLVLRLAKGIKHAHLISLLPPLLLFWSWTNIYIPTTLTVSVLLALSVGVLLAHSTAQGSPSPHRPRDLAVPLLLLPPCYWLLGPAAVLLVVAYLRTRPTLVVWGVVVAAACIVGSSRLTPFPLSQVARGIDYYWADHQMGTAEEMQTDLWLREHNWPAISRHFAAHPPTSPALQSSFALSLFQLRRIGQQELSQTVAVSKQALRSQSSAFIMSEVYMQMGLSSMAQRAAFEAMECIPNHNKSARSLRRLVETNLVTGLPDVAQKYIDILRETLFYRNWAQRMEPLTRHSDALDSHPTYGRLKQLHEQGRDVFFY